MYFAVNITVTTHISLSILLMCGDSVQIIPSETPCIWAFQFYVFVHVSNFMHRKGDLELLQPPLKIIFWCVCFITFDRTAKIFRFDQLISHSGIDSIEVRCADFRSFISFTHIFLWTLLQFV